MKLYDPITILAALFAGYLIGTNHLPTPGSVNEQVILERQ